jgi:hypothetical protein
LQLFCNCGSLTKIDAIEAHKGARAEDWRDRPARQGGKMSTSTQIIMPNEIVEGTPGRVAESDKKPNATIGESLAPR